ncbi:MAG: capsid scaffolding protein, partial [Sphingobacteriales bacterium]
MPELAGEGRVLKRFRVAREGQTVDGRTLTRQEIKEIAETYDPATYGGRINIEHITGWSPEPPFNAYGDIVLADAVEEGGKLCLYNTISALPNLVKLSKAGQKIYPSIEFYRDFAGSGKAYQVGLGLTDTPASLGTEVIKFSSANPNLSRTQPDTEICMFTQTPAPAASAPAPAAAEEKTLFNQLKELLTPKPVAAPAVPEDFNATVTQALVAALNGIASLNQRFDTLSAPAAAVAPATGVTVTTPAAAAASVAFAAPAATPVAGVPAAVPAPASDPVALLSQQVQ